MPQSSRQRSESRTGCRFLIGNQGESSTICPKQRRGWAFHPTSTPAKYRVSNRSFELQPKSPALRSPRRWINLSSPTHQNRQNRAQLHIPVEQSKWNNKFPVKKRHSKETECKRDTVEHKPWNTIRATSSAHTVLRLYYSKHPRHQLDRLHGIERTRPRP